MTIDQAIRHYEKVAEQFEKEKELTAVTLEMCKCADEHRQLADWLKELKRAIYLLKVTYDLLRKQEESIYVLNILSETIFYDGAECDGQCLMEDIENLLEYHE